MFGRMVVFAVTLALCAMAIPQDASATGGRVFVGGRGRTVIVNRGFSGGHVHVNRGFGVGYVNRGFVGHSYGVRAFAPAYYAPPVVSAPIYVPPVVSAPVYAPVCGVQSAPVYSAPVYSGGGGCGAFFGAGY